MPKEAHSSSRLRIAITMGDPNGIGPEIAVKAGLALASEFGIVLVGEPDVFRSQSSSLALPGKSLVVLESGDGQSGSGQNFGAVDADAGRRSMAAIRRAVELCLSGEVDAMVTAPISKEAIAKAGFPFPGHTEYIASLCGLERVLMVMVSGSLRVALATIHVPLRSVAALITRTNLEQRIVDFDRSLRKDFGLQRPRIAMLGLNPHAGDGGVLGDEEQVVMHPAIDAMRSEGIDVQGPYPADGFFGNKGYEGFDGVLAAYHDQGLIPFKTLTFNRGCNFSAGLPIVRTSPDHGTAFDIAGKGIANPESLIAAVKEAVAIVQSRRGSAEPDSANEAAS